MWQAPVNETWVAPSQYDPELVRVRDVKSALMVWAASHCFAGSGAGNVVAELLLDWMNWGQESDVTA